MSGDVLERLMPSLVRYLSLEPLRPYLLQKGLLTTEEYSQLLTCDWGGREQVEWALLGPYKRYSSTLCAEIAKYACQHGVAAIARHYSNLKLKRKLSKSTVNGLTCNVAIFCAV